MDEEPYAVVVTLWLAGSVSMEVELPRSYGSR